jgi:hypothetical protein
MKKKAVSMQKVSKNPVYTKSEKHLIQRQKNLKKSQDCNIKEVSEGRE